MATLQMEFFSNALRRKITASAILPIEGPAGTAGDTGERKFPTIYLLHGYTGSHTDWMQWSRIVPLALRHRVAVIMPDGNNNFYLDNETTGELYEKYLCEELVDLTRRMFPLSHRRQDTTIAGLSMGGYGALRNGLKRCDVFGSIFAFSSALITDQISRLKEGEGTPVAPYGYYAHVFGDLAMLPGSDRDPKALARSVMARGVDVPKVFMACGTEDNLLEANRDMHRCLSEIGMAHEYRESPGVHDWQFWDTYIERAMDWLYGKPGEQQ